MGRELSIMCFPTHPSPTSTKPGYLVLSYDPSQRTHSTITQDCEECIWDIASLSSTFGHSGNRSALATPSVESLAGNTKGDLGNAALSSSGLRASCQMFLRLRLATPLIEHEMGIWEMMPSHLTFRHPIRCFCVCSLRLR